MLRLSNRKLQPLSNGAFRWPLSKANGAYLEPSVSKQMDLDIGIRRERFLRVVVCLHFIFQAFLLSFLRRRSIRDTNLLLHPSSISWNTNKSQLRWLRGLGKR